MINPILASSARRRMRSLKTPIIITLYAAALIAFALFYSFLDFAKPALTITQMRKGVEAYTLLITLQFALLILVAPAMTAGSIAGERERQTLDLLRVTNTGSISIALGKLLESFGFLCLLIIASVPVLSLILITGGVSLGQVLIAVLFLLLAALVALSIGLFASALFKRTVTATVVSYLTVFGLGILTLVPLYWDVKKLNDIYNAAMHAGKALEPIEYVPVAFLLNPGLGLISLFISQTHAETARQLFRQYSTTLSATYEYLSFERFLVFHMVFLLVISVVLIALAALLVRPRGKDRSRRKRRRS